MRTQEKARTGFSLIKKRREVINSERGGGKGSKKFDVALFNKKNISVIKGVFTKFKPS